MTSRQRNLPVAFLLLIALAAPAAQTEPEKLIECGHWKRARTLVEARFREAPEDALANFLLSQVRNAFGDHESPLSLAEKAVALDGRTAKYHRQVAECLGVMAQHSSMVQQVYLARRFHHEVDAALELDPHDRQALRDLMEFYLLAPGILGGDSHKAAETAARLTAVDSVEGLLAQSRLAAFRKQPREAEAFLRRAVEAQPSSYKAQVELARFYLASANFDAARGPAGQAIAIDATRVDAYAVLAEVHAARGEWTELDGVLATSARQVPDDGVPYFRAAERLIRTGGDAPRAERYLRFYLSQVPEGNEPSLVEARALLRRTNVRANAYELMWATGADVGQVGNLRPSGTRPSGACSDPPLSLPPESCTLKRPRMNTSLVGQDCILRRISNPPSGACTIPPLSPPPESCTSPRQPQ